MVLKHGSILESIIRHRKNEGKLEIITLSGGLAG